MGALSILGEQPAPESALSILGGEVPRGTSKPKSIGHQLAVAGLKSLPGIGGTLGVAAGLPLAPETLGGSSGGMGMMGAMGGEALKQLGLRAMGEGGPATPQQAMESINTAGAIQGAAELIPQQLAKSAGGASKALMQSALGKRTLKGLDPAITALNEGTAVGRQGLKSLMAKIGQAGAATRQLVGMAEKDGHAISPQELTAGTQELSAQMGRTAEVPQYHAPNALSDPSRGFRVNPDHPVNQLNAKNAAFEAAYPNGIKPTQLQEMIQKWDAVADPIYKAQGKKQPITAEQLTQASWAKAMADQGRQWLRNLPGYGPLIENANAHTSALIGLKQALVPAAQREIPRGAMIAGRMAPAVAGGAVGALAPGSPMQKAQHAAEGFGGGLAAGMAAQQAGTPQFMSQLALMLQHPGVAQMLAGPLTTQMLAQAGQLARP